MNRYLLATLAISSLASAEGFVLNGDAVKGEVKFKQVCASCHGPEGKGDGPAGKALKPAPANYSDPANAERLTDEWVYKIIKEGGAANGKSPLMVAWKSSFSDQEIRDLAAYVRSKVYVPPPPAKPAPAGKAKAKK